MKKPRDPTKKKKKKLDDQSEDEALELEGPLITPGSGETLTKQRLSVRTIDVSVYLCLSDKWITKVRRVVKFKKLTFSIFFSQS